MFKNNLKMKIIFTSIFLIFLLIAFLILNFIKNYELDKYLDNTTQHYLKGYYTIYESYHTLASEVFDTLIDTKEVKTIFADASKVDKKDISRAKLYKKLQPMYKILNKYNIKQLHFHLQDNESFLRFHKPNKYGDNLSNFRETVKYVNLHKKPIDSFEEGRIYNGYRFVFPMIDNTIHLGSVEISFSTLSMSRNFTNTFQVVAPFLVLKDAIKAKVFKAEQGNYIVSQFKRFYIEKKLVDKISDYMTQTATIKVSKETKEIVDTNALNKDSFSLYDSDIKMILSFIKVQNTLSKQVIGFFIIPSSAEYIDKLNFYFYFLFFIIMIVIFLFVISLYKELHYRKNLEEKVDIEVEKNRLQDQQLIEQSRLAQMGEMISMIAHQWRQPLTAISSTSAGIQLKAKLDKLDNDTAIELASKISQYSQHLSETINDFRDFFKKNKIKEAISLDEIVSSTLDIIQTSIENKNIKIITNYSSKVEFYTYKNEIKQVVLNLIKNAEDILLEKEIKNPSITIKTYKGTLSVSDNGGGIAEDIIENIFDPYFSTKIQKDGTGLGLYMSKIIIEEHCGGRLHVSNSDEGAIFTIIMKKIKG